MKTLMLAIVLVSAASTAYAGPWSDNPRNWANSGSNWENSPSNWANSPHNWANSPNNYGGGNPRVIAPDGRDLGYAVPRGDGGVNYFDHSGRRQGYSPGW